MPWQQTNLPFDDFENTMLMLRFIGRGRKGNFSRFKPATLCEEEKVFEES
jgi:hypothetical protein